jgi:hypothetical protein
MAIGAEPPWQALSMVMNRYKLLKSRVDLIGYQIKR